MVFDLCLAPRHRRKNLQIKMSVDGRIFSATVLIVDENTVDLDHLERSWKRSARGRKRWSW